MPRKNTIHLSINNETSLEFFDRFRDSCGMSAAIRCLIAAYIQDPDKFPWLATRDAKFTEDLFEPKEFENVGR
jgi:hypothetical protein